MNNLLVQLKTISTHESNIISQHNPKKLISTREHQVIMNKKLFDAQIQSNINNINYSTRKNYWIRTININSTKIHPTPHLFIIININQTLISRSK